MGETVTSSYVIALLDGEPGAHGFVVPDCPGCVATGDTVDEAPSNGIEALADWAATRRRKGAEPPEARTREALRGDADVSEALARGALPVLVPVRLGNPNASRPG
jgi:predicted RNase H-like HicB family nuclease